MSKSSQLRFGILMPALLTRRSMRPCLPTIASAALFTSSLLLTSSTTASALPPLPAIFATTRSSSALRRPETTTVQPSAASASAPASPMPLPPPVTQATRFPPFVMQTVSVAFEWAFLLLQPFGTALRPALWGMLHERASQRQLVFSPVRFARRSEPPCDRNIGRSAHLLRRLGRARGSVRKRVGCARRQAGGPRRGPGREIGRKSGALSRHRARGRGLSAAQYRLHAE